MQIIIPPHSKVAENVVSMTDELKKEIEEMREMLKHNRFEGGRGALAIAHPQISETPLKMFVAQKNLLSHDVVINPEIVELSGKYFTKEMCLSYPKLSSIKIRRCKEVVVKYLTEDFKEVVERLTGLAAQVFQHENDHFLGKDIYN